MCCRELTSESQAVKQDVFFFNIRQMPLRFVFHHEHFNKVIRFISVVCKWQYMFLSLRIFQLVTYFMCETYFSSSVRKLNNQNYEIFAVSHHRPRLEIRQDKIMALKLSTLLTFTKSKLISSRSLNTSNVRGLEIVFFKPAILFDFASNVLGSGVSQCYLCRPVPK